MELRQLVYFEAVVRCGGFTRAAESLRIAQPAVSAQIRRLESELGAPLLLRTTRQVSLTAAGQLFLTRARRVLGELDAARSDMDEQAAVLRGRVCLGATPVLGPFDLPTVLAAFHRRYSAVTVSLRSGLVGAMLRALDDGDVDLVLGPIHVDLPARYTARALVGEQLVVITPPGHPLARRARVSLSELRSDPFVCLPAGSGLRDLLTSAAAAAGFDIRVQFEADDPAGVRGLVSAGLGIALSARSAALAPGSPVAVLELTPAPEHPPIGLIELRERSLPAAARACRQHLTDAAKAIPAPKPARR